MKYFTVDNREFYSNGRLIKLCGLVNAWYESIENPEVLVDSLRKHQPKQHIFTFFQRPPNTEPKFKYHMEPFPNAVIKVEDYDNWWNHAIKKYARQAVKRSRKYGVEVRETKFDDEFVKGVSSIFNESPIRLGKKFPHYNKSLEKVRKEVGTFVDRSVFIGAYCGDELVGYSKIVFEEQFADILNLLAKISHREKCITNALLAKVVEVCCKRRIGYIAYGDFESSTLGDFKRHNGFCRMDLPRYFIPLNVTGRIAIKLGFHRRLSEWVPNWMLSLLRQARSKWYERNMQSEA